MFHSELLQQSHHALRNLVHLLLESIHRRIVKYDQILMTKPARSRTSIQLNGLGWCLVPCLVAQIVTRYGSIGCRHQMKYGIVPFFLHLSLRNIVDFQHSLPQIFRHVCLSIHQASITQDYNWVMFVFVLHIVHGDLQKGSLQQNLCFQQVVLKFDQLVVAVEFGVEHTSTVRN